MGFFIMKKDGKGNQLRNKAEEILSKHKSDILVSEDLNELVHELQTYQIELEMQNEELQKVGKELDEMRLKYFDLYEFAPVGYFLLDKDEIINNVNLAGASLLGAEKSTLLNTAFIRFMDSESKKTFYDHLKKVKTIGTKQTCELKFIKKDGTKVYAHLETIFNQERDSKRFRITTTDITERKKVEKALQENEEFVSSIVENIPDMIFVKNADKLDFTMINKAGEELLGNKREELLGKTDYDFFPKDEADFFTSKDKEVLNNKKLLDIPEETIQTKKSGKKLLHTKKIPIFDSVGEPQYLLGISEDVTERKKVEMALIESEERNRLLVENAGLGIGYYDIDGKIIMFNKIAANNLNGKPADFEGKSLYDLFEKELASIYMERIKKSLNSKESQVYEDYFALASDKWFLSTFTRMEDHKGNIIGVQVISNDITERKKAELALVESEESFRMLFERSNAVMLLIEPDSGKIINANQSASLFYGYPLKTLRSMNIGDINQLPKEKIAEARENAKNEEIKYFNFQHKLANGEIRTVEVYSSPINFKAGLLLFSIIHDITDRKKVENQLKSSLKEKEVLLKEIHHRVKNNLQIISSLLDLQVGYVKEDPIAVNVLKESQNRVISMAMIHEMLYQSKDLSHIYFSDYVKMMVSNLFDSYGIKDVQTNINVEQIDLNIETAVPVGLIISELVSNSLKYAFPKTKEKGEVSVELIPQKGKFELNISDNGIGIPGEIDFRNTESTLGLRLVISLVNQLDGSIKLDRTQGTKFKIIFKELDYKERM
jgi:PAS domain S-box-containing protein